MLKKITMLLVFNLIVIHNSFAMEAGVLSILPFKKFDIGLRKYNKHTKDLNNQLRNLNSDREKIINENLHVIAKKNIAYMGRSIGKGLDVFALVIGISVGNPAMFSKFIRHAVEEGSTVLADYIVNCELKLTENNNVLDTLGQGVNNIISAMSKLKEKERIVKQAITKKPSDILSYYQSTNDIAGIDILRYTCQQIRELIRSKEFIGLISFINGFYHHPHKYYTNKYGYYNKTFIERVIIPDYICIPESVLKLGKPATTILLIIANYFVLKYYMKLLLAIDEIIVESVLWK